MGSDTTCGRESVSAKRSRRDVRDQRTANQAVAEPVSIGRGEQFSESTARKGKQSSVSREISGVWTHVGMREVGGSGRAEDIGRKCSPNDDWGRAAESAQTPLATGYPVAGLDSQDRRDRNIARALSRHIVTATVLPSTRPPRARFL